MIVPFKGYEPVPEGNDEAEKLRTKQLPVTYQPLSVIEVQSSLLKYANPLPVTVFGLFVIGITVPNPPPSIRKPGMNKALLFCNSITEVSEIIFLIILVAI